LPRLDTLRTREKPTTGNTILQKRPIITPSTKVGRLTNQLPLLEKVLIQPLDLRTSSRPRDVKRITIAIVDQVPRIRRSDHVKVQVQRNLLALGRGEVADVVGGADEPEFFSCPPAEAYCVVDAELGQLEGDLEVGDGTGAVVVDALESMDDQLKLSQ